ncbi:MAG: filamentous hemagglutinin N-terminal domain-containing protein, partial [Verrucomicrobiales bacterium]|nr:filamentous hemagglutinin N-terminal domain-containing protein [Verrucomicrobiales bacterium]
MTRFSRTYHDPSADPRRWMLAFASLLPAGALGNPSGPVVVAGTATVSTAGAHTAITASHNAVLNWNSFDLAPGESAAFLQPSPSSVVWNRVVGGTPSEIHGSISANGVVVLMNAAGFWFGPTAFVDAAGLVVSTAPAVPAETGSGLFWQFNGAPPGVSIVNYGRLQAGPGGSAFLIADRIENHGTVAAPGGQVGLAAGREVLLSERPDGRGLSARVAMPSGSIDQSGRVVADAGTIALHARVVNQSGVLQANAVRERDGVIELYAQDVNLGSSGTLPPAGTPPPAAVDVDVNSGFVGASRIEVHASRNITLAAGTTWDLPTATGHDEPGNALLLEAGNNVSLANGSSIAGGEHWSITLRAGIDPAQPDTVRPGVGSIALAGSATLQTGRGDIELTAGNAISIATGAARTVAGGDIAATAVSGSIQTGTRAAGFVFRPNGYSVDPNLGGISTAAGGDVRLVAGTDITSFLPTAGGVQTDAGSGAFGAEPGNVTISAGRDVAGHFVVRNGVGLVETGRDAGTPGRLLALSLVRGGWTIDAARDVLLQEIRNPNGLFNNLGTSTSANRHRFDYDPLAFASISAGRGIELRGTALPRYADVFSQGMPPIYPGKLTLEAGAGGVGLGNDVILFPSPHGHLSVVTTDGGSLTGSKPGDLAQLVLSDSGKTHYRAFGDFGIADRSADPFLREDLRPVEIDVAGSMSAILLGVPKRADLHVRG